VARRREQMCVCAALVCDGVLFAVLCARVCGVCVC